MIESNYMNAKTLQCHFQTPKMSPVKTVDEDRKEELLLGNEKT